MGLKIEKIKVGEYRTNCYVLTSGADLAVLDPGSETEKIISSLREYDQYRFRYILITHGHHDHFSAATEIVRLHPEFLTVVGKKEESLLGELKWQEKYEDIKIPEISIDRWVGDGDQLDFGNSNLKVLETPGHTPGGIAFLIDDDLFSGDTLFYHTVGRTDFPGGDANCLEKSLKKLLDLDEKVTVYPGHGKMSTIGEERQFFLKG